MFVGLLVQTMTKSDVVMQLLAQPQVALQYMKLVLHRVQQLDVESLLHIALQFDPSRAAMKPFLSRAVQHRKKFVSNYIMLTSYSNVYGFSLVRMLVTPL